MLTDEVIINVQAGKGGNGIVSFRHEKYAPRGGPDGGDGGDGGEVIFQVDRNTNTLTYFNTRKEFKADNGQDGGKAKRKGKNGQDLILRVPPGTIIYHKISHDQKPWQRIKDLTKENEQFIIAKGGRGGWGNVHFATSTYQTPRIAKPGLLGAKKILKLELRLIADVGLIGKPNSGKSTLLARITAARPKIANYPFTTLQPNLGVARYQEFSFVVADIPGLIKGASEGKGLGYRFLRHIQRTKIIVHLIDCLTIDPLKDYQEISLELAKFYQPLLRKPEIVVMTKVDTVSEKNQRQLYAQTSKLKPIFISAVSGRGINDLLKEIYQKLS